MGNDVPRLLIEERRREILRLLEQQGRVTVIDLSKRFQVSAVTVRDDLEALSDAGALVRSYGGAIRPLSPVQDFPLNFKKSIHQAEKNRIAAAAAALVQPHQTIILDSGSTSTLLAEQLKQLNPEALTVLTHALDVAWVLADSPGIAVMHRSAACFGISRTPLSARRPSACYRTCMPIISFSRWTASILRWAFPRRIFSRRS